MRQSANKPSQSARSASQFATRERTTVAERVIAFLRQQHPVKTPDHVAADTGIPAGTVQKWLDRNSAPNAGAIFLLIGAYGPEFIVAVMTKPPAWLDRVHREEEADRIRREIDALQRKLARTTQ